MKTTAFHSLVLFAMVIFFPGCQKESPGEPGNADDSREAWDLVNKAASSDQNGAADSAYYYFSQARQRYEKASDTLGTIYTLLRMSDILYRYSDFSEMQATSVEALKYVDGQTGDEYLPMIYNDLGRAYCQLGDYPRAIGFYRKSIDISKHPVHRLTAANNIAFAHISSNDFEKARVILDSLIGSPHVDDSLAVKARILTNLGYAKSKAGGDGKEYLLRGLELREQINDQTGIIGSALCLAEVLADSDRKLSIGYAERAEKLAASTKSVDDRLLALKFLSRYDSHANARHHADKYFRISDSIQSIRQAARSYFADVKYNYKVEQEEKLKSQAEAAYLQVQKSELELSRLLWVSATVGTILLAGTGLYMMIQRSRRKRIKAVYDTEVRISTRLHDELANDLHQTMVFTESRNLAETQNRNRLLDSLDSLYQRARAISREHATVDLSDHFADSLRDLFRTYVSAQQSVMPIGVDGVRWERLDDLKKVTVFRVLQELLVNMKKHSDASKAVFRFTSDGKKVSIAYSDNGKGHSGSMKKNGMAFMENRISAINGTFTFECHPGKGFRAKIDFPY